MTRANRNKHRDRRLLSGVQKTDVDYTLAGPVTITRSDGSTEQRSALSADELRLQVKTRRPIPANTQAKVKRRDKVCRYCGNDSGPYEIDHVVPVALGGTNRLGNLVLACKDCNGKKGARVWTPKRLRSRQA